MELIEELLVALALDIETAPLTRELIRRGLVERAAAARPRDDRE